MAKERMPITPAVLTWARKRAGYSVDELATKSGLADVAACELGQSRPTYRQLEKIAEILQLPVAIFFFPEPPEEPAIEQTYRTLGSAQFSEIPPAVRLLLHKGRAFQLGLNELNDGRNPAPRMITRDLILPADEPAETSASRIRKFIGVSLSQQFHWPNDDTAFKAWRSAFYRVGVTVFKDNFGVGEFCGFSLYDEEFPVIFVNNSNAKTRQIFTLFHELAHLLHHTSGVDMTREFHKPLPADKSRIEASCNQLAAMTLVPEEEFHLSSKPGRTDRAEAQRLAKRFSVSREVIYRKFLDRNWIIQAEYEAASTEWAKQLDRKKKKPGGNLYRTWLSYLGEDYVSLAFRRYYEEQIDDEKLADYLGIKPKHIDRLEETLLGER
jgi:Zn-dependent peptidase ImmA (M78 family)/transcriptional regulator with XRE-family HTH domain